MKVTLLLLGYFLFTIPLITFLVVERKVLKQLYLQAARQSESLERVRSFFKVIEPLLKVFDRYLNTLKAGTGNPPTDYGFQLRFMIWWKIFKPGPLETAIRWFNNSTGLKEILGDTGKDYNRFAYTRFREKLGERSFRHLMIVVVFVLMKEKAINLARIGVDSFPVSSFLNTVKCLRRPKINRTFLHKFFQALNLEKVLKLLPPDHKNAKPSHDKLKCWLVFLIQDFYTVKKCHVKIFEEGGLQELMDLVSSWKCPGTLENFIEKVKKLDNFKEIEKAILDAAVSAVQKARKSVVKKNFQILEDLNGAFHKPHRWKDPGATFNYCSSKHFYFFGRGALIIAGLTSRIPLLMWLTPRYKLSETEIIKFFKEFSKNYKGLLDGLDVHGDGEFGTEKIIEAIKSTLGGNPVVSSYGNTKNKIVLTKEQKNHRKVIERVIARLVEFFDVENPRCYGDERVAAALQEIGLCDLLIAYFNWKTGNKDKLHSIIPLRG